MATTRGVTVDQDLLELMPDMVTIEKYSGLDQEGFAQRTYGDPFRVRCRIEGRMRRIAGPDGSERMSSTQIYLAESPGVTPLDRITLPDPWTPKQPTVMGVERQSDGCGAFYEAIFS